MRKPFDGETAKPEDSPRLFSQLQRVFNAMTLGRWLTPQAIEQRTGDNWASISARLRDFRKSKWGGWTVERRSVPGQPGLFEYRLLSPKVD